MPYRQTPTDQPCAECEAPTGEQCRRCGAPLCREHSVRFEFYVPTIECAESGNCKPFEAAEVNHTRKPLTVKFAGVDVGMRGRRLLESRTASHLVMFHTRVLARAERRPDVPR